MNIKSQKDFVIPLVVGIIALLVAGGAYVAWHKNKTTPIVTTESGSWKMYSNPKFGFEFMYPGDWVVVSQNSQITIFNDSAGHEIMRVNAPIREVGYETFNLIATTTYPVVSKGYEFMESSYQDMEGGIAGNYYTIERWNKDSFLSGEILYYNPNDKLGEILHQILQTFKFFTPAVSPTLSATSSNLQTYTNSQYGFTFQYPTGEAQVTNNDITGGRAFYLIIGTSTHAFSFTTPLIEIDAQNSEYGAGGKMVQAQCNDYNYYASSTTAIFNGINFIKTDVSGDYGGMESAAVAQSYCAVHNGIRYRLIPRYQYSRYTGGTEKGDEGSIPVQGPDKALSFKNFDQVIQALNFKFTN